MVEHIPVMAAIHQTPLCVLSHGSGFLGSMFGMRSVVALGIKVLSENRNTDCTVLTTILLATQHPPETGDETGKASPIDAQIDSISAFISAKAK
jgi:hypothetical protein